MTVECKYKCEECGKELAPGEDFYYIGENHAGMIFENNVFCSEECLHKALMVDIDFVPDEEKSSNDLVTNILLGR